MEPKTSFQQAFIVGWRAYQKKTCLPVSAYSTEGVQEISTQC